MKAVRFHEYGGPDVLRYEDAPCPKPQPDEVLIRVGAAGVNPLDWKVRQGTDRPHLPRPLPLIPGWDVCGTVEAAGGAVRRFKPGDAVYGLLDTARDGAYAEYAVARETSIALKPRSLDPVGAAAIPLAALAAWQSLFAAGALRAGQRVLVHGAAGGVGSFAVQLAKWKGAHVTGTASGPNRRFLETLGADETIDHTRTRFEDVARDMDVVLDTVGGDTLERSWGVLKRGGILVSLVEQPSPEEAVRRGVRQAGVFAVATAEELAALAMLVDAGDVKPRVETVFPLAEARQAHRLSQTGHARGKIVLRVETAP